LFRAELDADSEATWLILLIKGTALHWIANPASVAFTCLRAEGEFFEVRKREALCRLSKSSNGLLREVHLVMKFGAKKMNKKRAFSDTFPCHRGIDG
jgi:hypothetical protein